MAITNRYGVFLQMRFRSRCGQQVGGGGGGGRGFSAKRLAGLRRRHPTSPRNRPANHRRRPPNHAPHPQPVEADAPRAAATQKGIPERLTTMRSSNLDIASGNRAWVFHNID